MKVSILKVKKNLSKDRTGDWCSDSEEYFVENCPIQRGDYNGCCLCTQVMSIEFNHRCSLFKSKIQSYSLLLINIGYNEFFADI